MRYYKKKETITKRKYDELINITCDICGEEYEEEPDCFHVHKTKVYIVEGSHYPEGGRERDYRGFDICVDCFDNKLKPFIESFGTPIKKWSPDDGHEYTHETKETK